MFLKELVISFIVVQLVNAGEHCDPKKCIIPKHYSEIGCTPIKENGQCCPSRYNCDFLLNRSMDHCYTYGRVFSDGDNIPSDLTNPSCLAACRCSARGGEIPAGLNCAHIECPEEVFNRPEPHCIKQKTLQDCCAKNIICDQEEINILPICQMNGKQYRLGQAIYPESEPCYTCVCSEDFDGSTVIGNKDCREINCGIEVADSNYIRDGCIPVYHRTERCCPINWRCPKETDKIETTGTRTVDTENPNMTCKFGNLNLELGDTLNVHDKCVKCTCLVPPMVHCIHTYDC